MSEKQDEKQRRGTLSCAACGAVALRKESRRTLSPKAPKVQLYVCEGTPQHFMEAVLWICHVDFVGQPKRFLNRYSTKGAKSIYRMNLEDFDE